MIRFRALRVLLPAASLAAIAGLPAGCGGGGGRPDAPETLVVGISIQPDRLNPLVSTGALSSQLAEILFLRLVDFGPPPALEWVPRLAESWELSEDRRTLDFRLRTDVAWADGVPTTAEDVKFTFDRALDPRVPFPSRNLIRSMESVEVTGPHSVRFHFSEPAWEPLWMAYLLPIVPKHLLEDVAPGRLFEADFGRNPVGNGPWLFAEWLPEERLVFEANPGYFGGRPAYDRVVFRVIPEQTTQRTELLTGKLDYVNRHPNKYFREDSQVPELDFVRFSDRGYVYIGWNEKLPIFQDVRVRKALTLATDRWTILEAFRDGFGKVSACPIYEGHPADHPTLQPLPFDPDSAAALLDEAGWTGRDPDGVRTKDGQRLEFEYMLIANNEISEEIATMTQAEFSRLGIHVDVEFLEWSVYVERLNRKEFEATLLARVGSFIFDPESVFHSRNIDGKYNDISFGAAVTDSLIDLAKSIPDRDERVKVWWRFFEELHELQPITMLYVSEAAYPVRKDRVAYAPRDVRGAFFRLHEWRPVGGGE
jgi:peptide/nickel transport system substrate-binding protein